MAPQPPAPTADEVTAPGKALRVGIMTKHLLDELRDTALDAGGRRRLRDTHDRTLTELADALSPPLRVELRALTTPFDVDSEPSSSELRIAHAQLVGWLDGLFQGLRATLATEQLMALQHLEEGNQRPQPRQMPEMTAHGTYL